MLSEAGPLIDRSFLERETQSRSLTNAWQRANDMSEA